MLTSYIFYILILTLIYSYYQTSILNILFLYLYYSIIENKQLRYKKVNKIIIFILCTKISLRLKNNKNRIKIVIEESYILLNLLYNIIVEIKFLKLNRIIIE